MIKSVYITAVVLSASISTATAGSMGAKDSSYDFNGFYAGLGTGFTTFFYDDNYTFSLSNSAAHIPSRLKSTDSAIIFDGHLGYGQFIKNNTYLGAKTSVLYTPLEHNSSGVTLADANNIATIGSTTNSITLKPIYNVNAILGYEVYPHLLPFVEGGVSFANVKSNDVETSSRSNLNNSSSYSYALPVNSESYKTGYNVGFGANYQVSKNWFLSSELIYNYLGKQSATATITLPADAGTQNLATNRTFQMISMLASVSYLLPVL